MIPEGTEAGAVTREQRDAVTQAVLDYIDRNKGTVSRTSIAREITVAGSTLGCVLNGKYPGSWQWIILELDRWLEAQQKRDALPKTSDFVWTSVAQEIRTVADMAITLGTIGLAYGPTSSGTGKTTTARALVAERAGAALATVEKVGASAAGVLASIARALRLGDSGGTAQLYKSIVRTLKNTSRLLIIDQCHNLCGSRDDRALFVLCDLLDATGAPQLWLGTNDIVSYLDRGTARGKESLAQIRRRIGISRDLMERTGSGDGGRGEPLYTVEEIRKVFAKNKVRLAPDATQYLATLANIDDSGALGACVNLVRLATTAAEARGESVLTAQALRAYHRTLVNGRAFSLLEARMEEYRRPVARVG